MRGSPQLARVTGLALAVAALACGSAEFADTHDVAVRVERVGLDSDDLPVVLLSERGGQRWLAIWIGSAEAESIAMSIEEIAVPRPNSHDLAHSVIDGLRAHVERVVVTELRGGTYYATLALRTGSRRVEIDARPSDAIAIALRSHAPIFVRDHLLARTDGGGESAGESI